MGGASLMPVAFFSLMLLCLIGIVLIIVVLLLTRSKRHRVTQSSCGQCLYPVEGLSGMTCPECGSDLREVGIITPKRSVSAGPLLWIVLWTLILPFPALFISRLVYVSLPTSWSNERHLTLHPKGSDAFTSVSATIWAYDVPRVNEFNWASFELFNDGASVGETLIMNLSTRQWRIGGTNRDALNAESISAEHVAEWMHETLDQHDPEHYQAKSQALLAHTASAAAVQPMIMGDQFTNVSINAVSWQRPAQWFHPVAWTFWVVAWAAGIVLIVQRHRRTQAKNTQTKSRIIDVAAS